MRTLQSAGKKVPAKDAVTKAKPVTPATASKSAPAAKRPKDPTMAQRTAAEPKTRTRARDAPAASSRVEVGTLVFERERMVAEAAYYRAERRGFVPGDELTDWFEAEAEIERQFGR